MKDSPIFLFATGKLAGTKNREPSMNISCYAENQLPCLGDRSNRSYFHFLLLLLLLLLSRLIYIVQVSSNASTSSEGWIYVVIVIVQNTGDDVNLLVMLLVGAANEYIST